ncbi:MAG: radical SAM protein [Candidatus Lokiarchaeota archaeon]
MNYKYVKTVKDDEIFGKILSANFIPYKFCDYNCVYCGLGPTTNKIIERKEFYPPNEVFTEIEDYFSQNNSVDYIWLTGIGEPTLYSHFKDLLNLIHKGFPNLKVGLDTNGALFVNEEIRKDFLDCDLILISFSSVFQQEFESICRPYEGLKIEEIMKGIKLFRQEFKNKFGIITIFIDGINDNEHSANDLKEYLAKLNLDYLFLQNYACKGYKPLNSDFKEYLHKLYEDVPYQVIYKF